MERDCANTNHDVDDIFTGLNVDDADPNLNGVIVGDGVAGRRSGAGGAVGGRATPLENGSVEESTDGVACVNRQGAKANADDNPFSFTKFLQGQVPFPSMDLISPSLPPAPPVTISMTNLPPPTPRTEANLNGDIFEASTPLSSEDGATSKTIKKEKTSEESKASKSNDDNPFSFKKFLNSAPDAVVTRPKVKVNSTLANGHQLNSVFDPAVPPDLASGLPSSSAALHHSSSASSTSSSSIASRLVDDRLRPSETLPDFAVDSSPSRRRFSTPSPSTPPSAASSASHSSSGASHNNNAAGDGSGAGRPSTSNRSRVDASRNSIPEALDSAASPVPPDMTLPASPRSFSSPLLNAKGEAKSARTKLGSEDDVAYPQEIKEVKGSLPDFLSEAAEALNAASSNSPERETQDRPVPFHLPSFPSVSPSPDDAALDADRAPVAGDAANPASTSSTLRRELAREKRKVDELEKKLEKMKVADRQTTDSLEKMIQDVERNLERTTSRAVAAEAANARLEEEAKKMRRRIDYLEKENVRLGGSGGCDVPQSHSIAKQIVASADNAEDMLRKLLMGVDAVRSLGHTLASMQKFEDVTPDEQSKSKRASPGAPNAHSHRRKKPADGGGGGGGGGDEEIEEIAGASGGVGVSNFEGEAASTDALWLNFDADQVEEQFLLSADLEKTKRERKPRKDPP